MSGCYSLIPAPACWLTGPCSPYACGIALALCIFHMWKLASKMCTASASTNCRPSHMHCHGMRLHASLCMMWFATLDQV